MPPADEEFRFIIKRLVGVRVDRVFELDEDAAQITGQWICTTTKDGTKTWFRVTEIVRGELPG